MDIKDKIKELKNLKNDLPSFYDYALKQMALRYLSIVIPITPTGESMSWEQQGHTYRTSPGSLKWGWIAEKGHAADPSDAEMRAFVERLNTTGNQITIANTADYALYVNYGHLQTPGRYVPALGKRLVNYWVPGYKFKETAENELAPYVKRYYKKAWDEWYERWNKES